MKTNVFAVLLLALATVGYGQTEASNGTFAYSGYLEGYYSFEFNEPADGRPYFYNHHRQNEFSANLALLRVGYSAERLRANFGFGTGTYFAANYAAEPTWAQFVYEGYGGVKLSAKRELWLDLGVLPSPYGYEGAISKDQLNLTRSFSAENSPYYLSGARLMGTFGKVTAAVLVLNGWQNIQETNTNKSLGTQVQYKPNDRWLFNWSAYYGDLPGQADNDRKQLFNDLYFSYTPNTKFQAIGLFDFGLQQQTSDGELNDATWHTANLTARYWLTGEVGLGGRLEYYTDRNVAIIVPTTLGESGVEGFSTRGASLNLDYRPSGNALLRVEGRYLFSSQPVFLGSDGLPTDNSLGVTVSLAVTLD